MTVAADNAWTEIYPDLSADRPGLLGSRDRASGSSGYPAGVDLCGARLHGRHRQAQIGTAHLKAAMAVWAYCEESAAISSATCLGDPLADES